MTAQYQEKAMREELMTLKPTWPVAYLKCSRRETNAIRSRYDVEFREEDTGNLLGGLIRTPTTYKDEAKLVAFCGSVEIGTETGK